MDYIQLNVKKTIIIIIIFTQAKFLLIKLVFNLNTKNTIEYLFTLNFDLLCR